MTARRLGCVLAAVCLALVATPAVASPTPPTGPAARPVFSASDADAESSLVAADDSRLTDLRTVASLARWQNKSWKTPYRIATGDGYTLVLTPSSTPYTLQDLFVLEPQTLLRLSDGSVLLEENIVVNAGAVLQLSQPGGLTLHLASSPTGFVSIVSFGGRVSLSGSRGHNLVLDGWDEQAGQRDTRPSDGRAYIRMIGGQFSMSYVEATALGFWSGRTGGIALTGTSRPDTGAVQSTRPGTDSSNGPTVTDHLGGTTITAAGALPSGANSSSLKYTVPAQSYVSSSITNSSVHGDAYGLFVSGASGVDIADSKFDDNQIAGIQLHRFVSDGSIERTEAIHNGGDGIALERGTQGIRISEANANYNAGNGFALSGRPLAEGPSAVGSPLTPYGNNILSNSTANHNGHYGVHVIGGTNITLAGNDFGDNDMGIVVSNGADKVTLTGNDVTNSSRHGIALITGVTKAKLTGNVISGGTEGIYLRDSTATVQANTIESAAKHGITVVGAAGGTSMKQNSVAGRGPSAVDIARASGTVSASANNVSGWNDSTPWYRQLRVLLRPMSLLWLMIFLLVALSALQASRQRPGPEPFSHPYAHQREKLLDAAALDSSVNQHGRHHVAEYAQAH
ncbi:MAG TPA: right-handed parallel beta-helix repeat-containing protein [Jatrophihabitantaceae bacterium]|jgi:parallel beta-helix repeat protein